MLLLLLLMIVPYSLQQSNQLQSLINFARGGLNPVPAPAPSAGYQAAAPTSGYQAAFPASPIPFSEVADPRRGVVEIDVPQPRPGQGIGSVGSNPASSGAPAPAPTPTFAGLPAGSQQVGGQPVSQARAARRPVPLNEINPPVFLDTVFPDPLNTFNPFSAPRQEPEESLTHSFLPGSVPAPSYVGGEQLPVLAVLNHGNTQALADNNRFSYSRFGGQVFQDGTGAPTVSQQHAGEHVPVDTRHPSFQQADARHRDAMRRHLQGVIQTKQEAGQGAQSPFRADQHTHHLPRLNIPGTDRHKLFEDELRLAQQSLLSLG